ncbi:unnamed protein product [Eruca vesicaria subsp. sativa]|uniref:Bromo domain-containing protein n=1 Tax=Eruca vesicaria subsp. sativa TaxID=29727 RepID=A0ABC8LC26_ERUVS|nr:unnamed protein product [Eruca vesicaria subsp. sativa]
MSIPFASDHPMLKVSLTSISNLEVKNLKRRLTSELDSVHSLIARFDPHPPQGGNNNNKKMKKTGFGLHDYQSIVKEPMDLGTVKGKLGRGLYETPLDFSDDVRLTFKNVVLYNPVGHERNLMTKPLVEPETVTMEKFEGDEEAPVDIRDLTMDENLRLSEELQDLPYDKLETVVQIVKKSKMMRLSWILIVLASKRFGSFIVL